MCQRIHWGHLRNRFVVNNLKQKSMILIFDLFPLKICVMETPARMVGPATLEHANVKMDSLVLPVKPMCVMSSIVIMMELALMV